ncbi:MAG: ribosomal protein S18-alanine N-acetyltransferase [Burkholderiales bacterium]
MSALPRPELRCRPLAARDLEAVAAIEQDIYEFPWTLGNFRDSLAAGYSCWAGVADGALAGYAIMMIGAGEAHLLNLSVAAPFQRRGFGRDLLVHLMGVARSYGARVLLLEVRPSNRAARALYAGFGFEQVGARRDYYPAREGREDALLLSHPL